MRYAMLAILLGGCLVVPPEPTLLEEQPGFAKTHKATFTLANFTEDVLLLEVVTEPGIPVEARLGVQLASSEGQAAGGQEPEPRTPWPCISYYSPMARGLTIGSLRSPGVILSAAGQEQEARYHTYGAEFATDIDFMVASLQPNVGVPVAVALEGAQDWAQHGGALELVLESATPFLWRLRDAEGSLACHARAGELGGGVGVDLGAAVAVRGKELAFHTDGSAIVSNYIGADVRYYATLESPQGQWLKAVHPVDGNFHWHWGSGILPPDGYAWQIHDLMGTNTPEGQRTLTAVVVHDVPDWVLYGNG